MHLTVNMRHQQSARRLHYIWFQSCKGQSKRTVMLEAPRWCSCPPQLRLAKHNQCLPPKFIPRPKKTLLLSCRDYACLLSLQWLQGLIIESGRALDSSDISENQLTGHTPFHDLHAADLTAKEQVHRLGVSQTWIYSLVLSPSLLVNLGTLLHVTNPQFLHL